MILTASDNMVRLDKGTDIKWRPPGRNHGGQSEFLLPLFVLVGKIRLLLRTDALDPNFGNLLVRQLMHALDAVKQIGFDLVFFMHVE